MSKASLYSLLTVVCLAACFILQSGYPLLPGCIFAGLAGAYNAAEAS